MSNRCTDCMHFRCNEKYSEDEWEYYTHGSCATGGHIFIDIPCDDCEYENVEVR